LVLNTAGRPIEFHCTAPIKPNRAQEILYGPTLGPYLFGEQIGQALLGKGQVEPQVVCTDLPEVLAVREFTTIPVVLVLSGEMPAEPSDANQGGAPSPSQDAVKAWRLDASHAGAADLLDFHVGRNHLALPAASSDDRRSVVDGMAQLDPSFDLSEPFSRIREAIDEARRGGQ
jgi:hypothetical protein